MKKIILAILLLVSVEAATSQTNPVPAAARDHAAKKYAGASDTRWSATANGYQAVFQERQTTCIAHYSQGGEWILTERKLPAASVPKAAMDAARAVSKKNHWQLHDVAEVENRHGTVYYRFLLRRGFQKKYESYDANGGLVSGNEVR